MSIEDVYPYHIDPARHRLAWVIFNAAGVRHDLETCEAIAKHIFDDLKCGPPGSAGDPTVKYDALGGSGAPWEPGRWIPMSEGRLQVVATAPPKDVTAMSWEERAELRAALEAAEDAERAGATGRFVVRDDGNNVTPDGP